MKNGNGHPEREGYDTPGVHPDYQPDGVFIPQYETRRSANASSRLADLEIPGKAKRRHVVERALIFRVLFLAVRQKIEKRVQRFQQVQAVVEKGVKRLIREIHRSAAGQIEPIPEVAAIRVDCCVMLAAKCKIILQRFI